MWDSEFHCDVRIRHQGKTLNVYRLIELSRAANTFALEFIGDDGESRLINFHPNRDVVAAQQNSAFKNFPNCHFVGFYDDEYSSLSTCSLSQFGGILSVDGKRFVLAAEKDGAFVLSPQGSKTCRFGTRRKRDPALARTADYYAKYLDGKWRYVELALVADHSVFEKYEKNSTAVQERLHTIANHMNALYQPLNFRVVIVWADIWIGKDPILVQANSDQTLSDFVEFRKTFIKLHHNDNSHLITNVRFDDNVVGKAFKGTMCSYDYSGGVDMDHHPHAALVAATVAHEMGHNLGMEHDSDTGDCKCPSKTGCIMAPSTGGVAPTFWSECSLQYLQASLSRKSDYCLLNQPKEVYGGARCGNSIIEDGEECDCGSTVSCSNKCCDPKTCKLVKDAQCATGDCCDLDTCKVKAITTRCREPTNTCDLPEYCDGQMEHCPADFYVQDGLPCPDHPEDFCFDGKCGSKDGQCKLIWGPTGRNADARCYELNTIKDNVGGNCGYEQDTNKFIMCEDKNKLCGRLQCYHETEKHAFADIYSVSQAYTPIRLSTGQDVACRVAWIKYISGKKERDPGMVPNGALCGDDMMCVNAKCKNRTEETKMAPKCRPQNCNNAGICNNMGNCHCKGGYGGTDCAIPGHGGSVNSGPAMEGGAFNAGFFVFWLLFAAFVIFCIASYYVKKRKNIWLHKEIWKKIKKTFNIQRLLVPVRKAPPPPGAAIRTADLNALWGDAAGDALRQHNFPSSVSPPVIPSGSFPPNFSQHPSSKSPYFAAPRMSELQSAEKHGPAFNGDVMPANYGITNPQTRSQPRRQLSTSSSRPTLPPPVPPAPAPPPPLPHKDYAAKASVEKPPVASNKPKPVPPSKPVVASKSKVKDIAARFDPKTTQLTTSLN